MPWFAKCGCSVNTLKPSSIAIVKKDRIRFATTDLRIAMRGVNKITNSEYQLSEIEQDYYCYIKDKASTEVQDNVIANATQKGDTASKELIFDYFDFEALKVNRVLWEGGVYNIVYLSKNKRITIEGTRFEALEGRPFIILGVSYKAVL